MKRYSSLVIKKIESKTTMRYLFTPIRIVTIQTKKSTERKEQNKYWRGYGEIRTPVHCEQEQKLVQPLWKSLVISQKINIEFPSSKFILGKKTEHRDSNRYLYDNVYSCIFRNSQKVETTQLSISR